MLIEALDYEDSLARRKAMIHLGACGPKAKSATKALLRKLEKNDEYEKMLSATALSAV